MKVLTGILIGMLVLSMITVVIAEDVSTTNSEDNVQVTNAGIAGDSPVSGLDRALERIHLAFVRNKERKAEIALQNAEERLAETKDLIERNKIKTLDKAEQRQEEALQRAQGILDEIASGNENQTKDALEKVIRLQNKIEAHKEKVNFVKEKIIEKHGENLTDEQLAHIQEVFDRIENKTQDVEDKLSQKRENLRTTYKVLSEKTDDEVSQIEQQLEDKTNVTQFREQRISNEIARTEKVLNKVEERLQKAQLTNDSEITGALDKAKAKLDEAKQFLSENKLEEARHDVEQVRRFLQRLYVKVIHARNDERKDQHNERIKELREQIKENHEELNQTKTELRQELQQRKADRLTRIKDAQESENNSDIDNPQAENETQ